MSFSPLSNPQKAYGIDGVVKTIPCRRRLQELLKSWGKIVSVTKLLINR
jgi:hypothetical protein